MDQVPESLVSTPEGCWRGDASEADIPWVRFDIGGRLNCAGLRTSSVLDDAMIRNRQKDSLYYSRRVAKCLA